METGKKNRSFSYVVQNLNNFQGLLEKNRERDGIKIIRDFFFQFLELKNPSPDRRSNEAPVQQMKKSVTYYASGHTIVKFQYTGEGEDPEKF